MHIRIFSKNIIFIFLLIPAHLECIRVVHEAMRAVIDKLNPNPAQRALWDPLGVFESCEQAAKTYPSEFVLSKSGYNLTETLKTPFSSFKYDRKTLFKGELDPNKEIVILLHGFLHGCYHRFVQSTKAAYLKSRPETQLVIVCWSKSLSGLEINAGPLSWATYLVAYLGTDCVGRTVAKFMEHLHTDLGVPWEKMSIVSHSLGTQVAGAAGNHLPQLKKLIALDPSYGLPGFSHLTNTSAKNVIILHTSMSMAQPLPIGTADFYANTGLYQPGCNQLLIHIREQCNHFRSAQIFHESLGNPKAFLAKKTKGRYGKAYFSPETEAKGVFEFRTRDKTPFSLTAKATRDKL